jgi:hypothetical protein
MEYIDLIQGDFSTAELLIVAARSAIHIDSHY